LRQEKIDRVAWFCPVSLKETVKQEILKHTFTNEDGIHVFDDKTEDDNLPNMFWHIIGIESVGSSNRVTLAVNKLIDERTLVIVDESQYIKGHKAKRTERLTLICSRARYRLILTGTPLSQGVVDLYAQMRFLSPKILGYASFYSFAANHLEYSDKYKGMIVRAHNTEYLAAKIRPYVYQVTKKECLDLPVKLFETRYYSMTAEQREAYEQAKIEFLTEDEFDSITIFRLFMALQQITCGFWNRRDANGQIETLEFSNKRLDTLLDTIEQIQEQEKIIVWAKYVRDIESISASLVDAYGPSAVARYYGKLNEGQRAAEVLRFRQEARFLVATQSTGGNGLTLNESHTAIFYNNSFKYAHRQQSEDRFHRIGQTEKCLYIDIHCSRSIDDRIAQALASKGGVVEAFKREVDKVKKSSKQKLIDMVKSL
jgi:SNF2 family DNA or RNA helicase